MNMRSVSAAAIGAFALAGCGGGSVSVTPTTPSSTARTPAADAVALSIASPDGDSVPAKLEHGSLTANIKLSGRGAPFSTISVHASCSMVGCQDGADVDASGRWHTSLQVQASRSRPLLRITAEFADEVAISTVQLTAPKSRTAAPRPTRSTRPAPKQAAAPPVSPSAPAPSVSSPAQPTATTTTPLVSTAPSSLLLIGDSLGVGTAPPLKALLSDWQVAAEVHENRTLAQGMSLWAARSSTPAVAAFSLFTNDDPRSLTALRAAVKQTLADHASGCVIWATILRPAVGGVTYAAANRLLEELAAADPAHLLIVDWAAEAPAHPAWLAPDRVHGTAAGYAARAQMYAQAARRCRA